MSKEQEQATLLHSLEQDILIVTGSVRVHRMRGSDPHNDLAPEEERLGEMLQSVLKLKALLGVPTSLTMTKDDRP